MDDAAGGPPQYSYTSSFRKITTPLPNEYNGFKADMEDVELDPDGFEDVATTATQEEIQI